jgi:hypothetical protein
MRCSSSLTPPSLSQLFFERFLQEQLEAFDPKLHDIDTLCRQLESGEDYVFNLCVKQLLSHLDLSHVFSRLPNLSKLELTYGVKQIGMDYERALFGMKSTFSEVQSFVLRG